MADLINPYANPYLPRFVNQQPVINASQTPNSVPTPQMNLSGMVYNQIHSVKGFEGADNYNLANGSSEILAEEDPNMARVYITAKDANGQMFVQGYDLTPVERPKVVTMDDLSSTMNQILDRLDRLEGERNNDQSIRGSSWKGAKQSGNAGTQSNGRNGANNPAASDGAQPYDTK